MWKTTSDIVIVNEATLVDWKRHNERMFQNRNIVMTKQFGLRSFVADEIRSKYKSICTSSMFYVPSREHIELHHFRAQIPNSSFTCRSSIFCFFSSPNEQKMYCRMLQYILHTAFRHSFEHIVGRNGSGSSTNSNSHIDAFSHFPLVSFSMIPY